MQVNNHDEGVGATGYIKTLEVAGQLFGVVMVKLHADMEPKARSARNIEVTTELAAQFREQFASYQLSAVYILDISAAVEATGADTYVDMIEQWLRHAPLEEVDQVIQLTHQFGRPVFQVLVAPGVNTNRITRSIRAYTTATYVPYYVNTMDEGLAAARNNLRLAHRMQRRMNKKPPAADS